MDPRDVPPMPDRHSWQLVIGGAMLGAVLAWVLVKFVW